MILIKITCFSRPQSKIITYTTKMQMKKIFLAWHVAKSLNLLKHSIRIRQGPATYKDALVKSAEKYLNRMSS